MNPDRIGDDRLGIPGEAEARALRVERREEAVLRKDLAFRQGIQERRFPGVGVPHDGDDGETPPLPADPALPPGLLDPLQLLFQVVDPIPEAPAVDLQLGLAGARAADPPRKPGETRVLPGEAGESVLELGELHLDLPLPAVGALGEDVEDHLGAVDDLHLGEIGDRADLGGAQLVVEDEQVRPHLERPDDEVGELPPADEIAGVHLGAALDDSVEDLDRGGAAELLELGERRLAVEKGVRLHPDEDGAVDGLDLARLLPSGKLALEGGDEGGEVDLHLRGTLRVERLPEAPLGVFRDQVGGMSQPREAVLPGFGGAGSDRGAGAPGP